MTPAVAPPAVGAEQTSKEPGLSVLSRAELEEQIRREAELMLGVPADEALGMLERGELRGTAAETQLTMLRDLLGD